MVKFVIFTVKIAICVNVAQSKCIITDKKKSDSLGKVKLYNKEKY